ncbi:Plasmodium exported protein, unknown function [Plasmodium gallinaceum]|uniref:Fam-h protein n=1 Tax=Plasmodium gallinaceum TaxID=5849 RepID=A0A1J1GVY1_PLAGA|nr:Plasmodium exported protein, unknown function [Plasmodium gallinaceum]CRG95450.1 Plasmodium exported protein, unknown function [Plasmodium gallinaceum]
MRNLIISNVTSKSRNNTHIAENFIIEDISTSRKYHAKGKINKFIFFIKVFLFTLLNIQRSLNEKCSLKNNLNLGAKRFLAENKEITELTNDELKTRLSDLLKTLEEKNTKDSNVQSDVVQGKVETIEIENENSVSRREKSNKKINSRDLMEKYKKCMRLFNLASIILLPVLSMTVSIVAFTSTDQKYINISNIITSLYLVLNSILLSDLRSNKDNK